MSDPSASPSILEALRAIQRGKRVQPWKHVALRRACLIRVVGHGKTSRTFLTGSALLLLADAGRRQDEAPR
jgi:hypothetical protein